MSTWKEFEQSDKRPQRQEKVARPAGSAALGFRQRRAAKKAEKAASRQKSDLSEGYNWLSSKAAGINSRLFNTYMAAKEAAGSQLQLDTAEEFKEGHLNRIRTTLSEVDDQGQNLPSSDTMGLTLFGNPLPEAQTTEVRIVQKLSLGVKRPTSLLQVDRTDAWGRTDTIDVQIAEDGEFAVARITRGTHMGDAESRKPDTLAVDSDKLGQWVSDLRTYIHSSTVNDTHTQIKHTPEIQQMVEDAKGAGQGQQGQQNDIWSPETPAAMAVWGAVLEPAADRAPEELNQDQILTLPNIGLFGVTDGAGGEVGGHVAPRVIVDSYTEGAIDLARASSAEVARLGLIEILNQAHTEIRKITESPDISKQGGMATATFAKLLGLSDGKKQLAWVNVGDSRLIKIDSAGKITRITTDETLVDRLPDGGQSLSDADYNNAARTITNAVGHTDFMVNQSGIVDVNQGDTFVIASDGIWGDAREDQITDAEIVYAVMGKDNNPRNRPDEQTAAENLVRISTKPDDKSVIVFRA